jgi:hypothetical protein
MVMVIPGTFLCSWNLLLEIMQRNVSLNCVVVSLWLLLSSLEGK